MSKLFKLIIDIVSLPFKIIGIPLKIIDTILKLIGLLILAFSVYFLNLIPAYTDFVNHNLPGIADIYFSLKKAIGLVKQEDIDNFKNSFLNRN
jgi:uncharacterized membrane protein